jgi:hypothetical protein
MSDSEMIHRVIKMKNYSINPSASQVSLTIEIDTNLLENEGWDFSEWDKNTSAAKGISIEDAITYNRENYTTRIRLTSTENGIYTELTWFSYERNEDCGFEATGDDEQTIKDICNLLENGSIEINNNWDYTVDSNDNYTPTFIEC